MSKTMTTNELTGRELDAAIAQCLGWRPAIVSNYVWQMVPPNGDGLHVESCPKYSTDIAAAFGLQAELEQRGLGPQYAEVLDEGMGCSLIGLEGKVLEDGVFVEYSDVFRLISATAEQRASAALKVLRRAKQYATAY